MSKFLLLFVVILIGIGAYLWYDGSLSTILESIAPPAQQNNIPQVPVATTTDATSTPTTSIQILPTDLSDTSDTALITDIQAIDAQIANLKSDNANMNTDATTSIKTKTK